MTIIELDLSPERYRAETRNFSIFWWLILPLATVFLIPVLARYYPEFFRYWIQSEVVGVMEFTHFLFPVLAAFIGIRLLFFQEIRSDSFVLFWVLAMIGGCIYIGGEEASWGQHYFGWTTPEILSRINDQNETNLHNISSWLDQKPRAILLTGIIVGGLIFPWFIMYRPGKLPGRYNFIYPPKATIFLSLLVMFGLIYGSVRGYLIPDEWNRLRSGEWLELYYSWFLLYYALFLLWRAKNLQKQ
ncbi:MAG: hypothetical protein ACRBBN_08505 [Methyloligellaceae bacterium]